MRRSDAAAVVWGVGEDEREAREDAQRWLGEVPAENRQDAEQLPCVMVSIQRAQRIEEGDVDAADLYEQLDAVARARISG